MAAIAIQQALQRKGGMTKTFKGKGTKNFGNDGYDITHSKQLFHAHTETAYEHEQKVREIEYHRKMTLIRYREQAYQYKMLQNKIAVRLEKLQEMKAVKIRRATTAAASLGGALRQPLPQRQIKTAATTREARSFRKDNPVNCDLVTETERQDFPNETSPRLAPNNRTNVREAWSTTERLSSPLRDLSPTGRRRNVKPLGSKKQSVEAMRSVKLHVQKERDDAIQRKVQFFLDSNPRRSAKVRRHYRSFTYNPVED